MRFLPLTKSCGTRRSDLKGLSSKVGISEWSKSQRKQMSSKSVGLVLKKIDSVITLSELRIITATVITSSLPTLPFLLIGKDRRVMGLGLISTWQKDYFIILIIIVTFIIYLYNSWHYNEELFL